MEKLICESCGAPLNPNSLKCEYCGTHYKRDYREGVTHYIQTCPAKVEVLASQISIPDMAIRHLDAEQAAEYATKELARGLAEALMPYMKIETHYEPIQMRQVIRGTVRVVEPDFRF